MSISHRVAALACLCLLGVAPVEAKAPVGMESTLAASVASMRMNPTQHWYGCYMLGKKVGHGRIWVGPPAPGERGAIATEMEIWMTIQAGAVSNPMRVLERRVYGESPPYPLSTSRFTMEASGVTDARVAQVRAEGLRITRSLNGKAQPERVLPMTGETLTSQLQVISTAFHSLRVGTIERGVLFDWTLEGDTAYSSEVTALSTRKLGGVSVPVATIKVSYEKLGMSAQALVAESGVVLSLGMGMGIQLKLEEESVARSAAVGLDVAAATIPTNRPLGRPHDITELKLQVSAPDGLALPDSARQHVVSRRGKGTMAIHEVTLRTVPGASVLAAERKSALVATAVIDKDAGELVILANRLKAGAEKSRRALVDALMTWVHVNLKKQLATHLPSASTVLKERLGDCTEHTWLFVALARAVGIPARPVYGVAWTSGGFGYHAWAEVALDGRWEAVDPTWGQLRADATHFALGDSPAAVAVALGQLKIKVVAEPTRGGASPGP